MQTKTFTIEKNHKLAGRVFLNEWPGKGYSARFEEFGRACPSAVAVGTTEAEAIYNLAGEKFAKHFAPQIKRVVLKLNAN